MGKLRMNQAVARAMADAMRADPDVLLFGEDVGQAGGVFKTSEGLFDEFGATRVRDTPISEMGFLGAGVGAAATGLRPIVEIMFVEFLGVALDQLSTEAAKFHYLSGGRLPVPLVVRASVAAGLGFGCQHSQTLETWFQATPGLKVCVTSGARTAYGLLRSAIADDNPVIVLEPRTLYGNREDFEPGDDAAIPLGQAEVRRDGEDVTVVGLGQTVDRILDAAADADWSADVIDLLTVSPWDQEAVLESASRTGRLVIVEESPASGGWGTAVAATASAELFGDLEAPVLRITTPDVPVPFGKSMEQRFVPSSGYIHEQIDELLATGRRPAPWWEQEVSS